MSWLEMVLILVAVMAGYGILISGFFVFWSFFFRNYHKRPMLVAIGGWWFGIAAIFISLTGILLSSILSVVLFGSYYFLDLVGITFGLGGVLPLLGFLFYVMFTGGRKVPLFGRSIFAFQLAMTRWQVERSERRLRILEAKNARYGDEAV